MSRDAEAAKKRGQARRDLIALRRRAASLRRLARKDPKMLPLLRDAVRALVAAELVTSPVKSGSRFAG